MKVTTLTHAISAEAFAREINLLVDTLEKGGYSTQGLDFTDIVARRLGDAFAELLSNTGARIKNHSWELKSNRSLRIKLYLPYEEDVHLVQGLISPP